MFGCPGSLMSLYGPTFHVTPVDLCIILQCNLFISCIMSCGNKFVSNCFKLLHDAVGVNCKNGGTTETQGTGVKYMG